MLYLTGRGKPHRWSERDRGLAEGLLSYEQSLGSHGFPSWIAEDPERVFEIDEKVDHAQAALDEAREEYQRGDNVAPGLQLVLIDQGKPDRSATRR